MGARALARKAEGGRALDFTPIEMFAVRFTGDDAAVRHPMMNKIRLSTIRAHDGAGCTPVNARTNHATAMTRQTETPNFRF